jgi:tRNA A58 N-methylase Trm61
MKNNRVYANKVYVFFSKLEGNQHIASEFAIQKILDLVSFNKSKNFLEIGLGIGSISFSIISYLNAEKRVFTYTGTESNEFCLNQLPINLGQYFSKIDLFSDLNQLENGKKFDFIIVDGSDSSLENICNHISDNGVIFIEGDRKYQSGQLLEIFPNHKFVHLISNYRNSDLGPFKKENWSGGGKLIYVKPTIRQNINWIFEKFKSSFRNRIIRRN